MPISPCDATAEADVSVIVAVWPPLSCAGSIAAVTPVGSANVPSDCADVPVAVSCSVMLPEAGTLTAPGVTLIADGAAGAAPTQPCAAFDHSCCCMRPAADVNERPAQMSPISLPVSGSIHALLGPPPLTAPTAA